MFFSGQKLGVFLCISFFLQVSSTNRSVPKRQQTLTLEVFQGIYQNDFHSEVTNS